MKCYHHNDLDGRCAAAIVYKFYDNCVNETDLTFREVGYHDEIKIDDIKKDENVFIVDFSFKPELMERVLKITERITWLDHHKTALEYKYSKHIAGIRSNNKYSGCELTWMYLFGLRPMPPAVCLIGDMDKWAWKLKDTENFITGLETVDQNPKSDIWKKLFSQSTKFITSIIRDGKACVEFRNNLCKDYSAHYGFETKFEGYKCFATGLYKFGSKVFGNRISKYDLCLSFVYLGDKWMVGLYSEKIDVSKIAVKYGGGGHKGAAGFVCQTLPFKKEE